MGNLEWLPGIYLLLKLPSLAEMGTHVRARFPFPHALKHTTVKEHPPFIENELNGANKNTMKNSQEWKCVTNMDVEYSQNSERRGGTHETPMWGFNKSIKTTKPSKRITPLAAEHIMASGCLRTKWKGSRPNPFLIWGRSNGNALSATLNEIDTACTKSPGALLRRTDIHRWLQIIDGISHLEEETSKKILLNIRIP